MKNTSNGHLLERLLQPIVGLLDEDAARKLVQMKSDPQVRARVAKLADKCNEGELTPHERSEYEAYVMAGEIIAILQAQARVRLSRKSSVA
jgi:hypothetical protein